MLRECEIFLALKPEPEIMSLLRTPQLSIFFDQHNPDNSRKRKLRVDSDIKFCVQK